MSIGDEGMLTGSLAVRAGTAGFCTSGGDSFGGVVLGLTVAMPIFILSLRSGEGEAER
jgi:hypothetical protein